MEETRYESCSRCGKEVEIGFDGIRVVATLEDGYYEEFTEVELSEGIYCEDCGEQVMMEEKL